MGALWDGCGGVSGVRSAGQREKRRTLKMIILTGVDGLERSAVVGAQWLWLRGRECADENWCPGRLGRGKGREGPLVNFGGVDFAWHAKPRTAH